MHKIMKDLSCIPFISIDGFRVHIHTHNAKHKNILHNFADPISRKMHPSMFILNGTK